mgnify:CR=1 FL=1
MSPNQPAFPLSDSDNPKLMGLTKREYFIAVAMQGIMANASCTPTQERHLIKKLNEDEQ